MVMSSNNTRSSNKELSPSTDSSSRTNISPVPTLSSQQIPAFGIRFSATKESKEVGRAFLYILHNGLHKEPFGFMEDVFVEESCRGEGIGTALVHAVIAEAKKQGCTKLISTSRHTRPKVHALYERLGFKNWGTEFRMDFEQ